MFRAENILLTTTVAKRQRDMEDLGNGVMSRSRVPETAAATLAQVITEEHERARKPETGATI